MSPLGERFARAVDLWHSSCLSIPTELWAHTRQATPCAINGPSWKHVISPETELTLTRLATANGIHPVVHRIRAVGFEPVDTGPLRIARYLEPFSLAMAQLAYEGAEGPEIAYRIERLGK